LPVLPEPNVRVAFAAGPRAVVLPALRVPALTVTPPVKRFPFERTVIPVPAKVSAPLPEITPLKVRFDDVGELLVIVRLAVPMETLPEKMPSPLPAPTPCASTTSPTSVTAVANIPTALLVKSTVIVPALIVRVA